MRYRRGAGGLIHLLHCVFFNCQACVCYDFQNIVPLDGRSPVCTTSLDTFDPIWLPLDASTVLINPLSNAQLQMNNIWLPRSLADEKELSDKYPVKNGVMLNLQQSKNRQSKRHETRFRHMSKRFRNDPACATLQKTGYSEPTPTSHYESPTKVDLYRRGLNTFRIVAAVIPTLLSSAPLDEDGSDVSYFATVRIGSRMKPFRLVVDTGSSDLWVPAADCTSAACLNHATFGPADSSTYRVSTTPWKISYGSGSASGFLVADTMILGGLATTSPVLFGTASQLADSFTSFPTDGILGLGNSSASAQRVPTFVDNLAAMGLISRRLFSINLQRAKDTGANSNNGQISFGLVDTTKFCGQIVTTPNIAKNGLWEAKIDGIYINNNLLRLGPLTGIIDTGTTLLLVPPLAATEIHRNIPGARTDSSGSFTIPCSTTASISMSFGGTQFFIDPRDYVGSAVDATNCLSNFVGQQFGGPQQVLIGDVFLKNVYSVFDFDNQEIGFGAKSLLHTAALM